MAGFAIYLFGIAIFRPIALRVNQGGISAYYAPPMTWDDISDFDTFKDTIDSGPFYTMHVGIKVSRTTILFAGLSRRRYDKAIRATQRSGYHILIPQMILKDMGAASVVAAARRFQSAARPEGKTDASTGM